MTNPYRIVTQLDDHPIPLEQDEIDAHYRKLPHHDEADAPSVDEAHEEYTETIAEYGDWHVFRVRYPFPQSGVVFWNRAFGTGFVVEDEEGQWHELVNLFAEIVEEKGDCRDAEYSDTLMPSGGYTQRCKNCGGSWGV